MSGLAARCGRGGLAATAAAVQGAVQIAAATGMNLGACRADRRQRDADGGAEVDENEDAHARHAGNGSQPSFASPVAHGVRNRGESVVSTIGVVFHAGQTGLPLSPRPSPRPKFCLSRWVRGRLSAEYKAAANRRRDKMARNARMGGTERAFSTEKTRRGLAPTSFLVLRFRGPFRRPTHLRRNLIPCFPDPMRPFVCCWPG